jgi:hypothetical protein
MVAEPGLPRVGEVLDLGAGDWSYVDGRRRAVLGGRPLRFLVSAVDVAGAASYAGTSCWVFGAELDEAGTVVRCLDVLVSLRSG